MFQTSFSVQIIWRPKISAQGLGVTPDSERKNPCSGPTIIMTPSSRQKKNPNHFEIAQDSLAVVFGEMRPQKGLFNASFKGSFSLEFSSIALFARKRLIFEPSFTPWASRVSRSERWVGNGNHTIQFSGVRVTMGG